MLSNPLNVIPFVQRHRSLNGLLDESLIDLQMSILDEPDAYDHVIKCHLYLRLRNQYVKPLLCDQVSMNKFEPLFNEVTGKRQVIGKYITGLLVFMATDETSTEITPIYQPVCLDWKDYDGSAQKDRYVIQDTGYGNYYIYDGNDFAVVSEAEKNKLVANYRKDMSFIHTIGGANYDPFNAAHDVTACLVTFQLIYKLLDETPSETLFVTNGIREIRSDQTSPIKHMFIFSGEAIKEHQAAPAKYANRSHLCPPCSTIFGFDLA